MTTRDAPTVCIRGAARWRIPARAAQEAVLATLRAAAPDVLGEVTVVFTGDRSMRSLNRRFRGKDKTTDVLSFELGDGEAAGEPFGDVVVSIETARRQARDYAAPLVDEVKRLLVHGTLHLCGYDHQERREAARMHGLTRRLLARLSAGARSVRAQSRR